MSTATSPNLAAVGDRTGPQSFLVSEILSVAGVSLPAGSPGVGVTVAGIVTPAVPDANRTQSQWKTDRPVGVNDTVIIESVITRVAGGRIERHIMLRDEAGAILESGTETWTLDDPAAAVSAPELDFCSAEWGNLLSDSLEDDRGFTSSLSTWDGTIGLRCGDRELHLRVYKGNIIDVTRRVPHGATFTFVAPAHTWVDLVLSDADDFMRRAISGEFSSTGDGYEYLRLTKPLNMIIAHARLIAGKADS